MSVPHKYRAAPLALLSPMTALTGNLNGPGHYIDWGPIQISLANLVMILIGLALFVAALLLPFPKGRKRP
jgi:hypothetical protein